MFSSVDRSSRGDSKGGVVNRKQRCRKNPENFSDNRGGLITTEDSKDEGGRGQSAIRPLDGLPKLEPWQNPNPSLP